MTDDVFASMVQGISGIVTRTALGQGPPETISNFLTSLGETHQIMPGEGIVSSCYIQYVIRYLQKIHRDTQVFQLIHHKRVGLSRHFRFNKLF
jgi:hypothetical protein